ncbi:DNA adenine methylase [Desulfallas thermosapovorans]|uniref:Site-specific DNA-methyltransferase (adenine-specific) n=1 Tax=Desulfallas thermosapovorans DSM 6562 TaxID=1121431 RepID=A0A5S4ZPF5_9FIRM|nr:DNA adenine methylase [Desulfallas thermosapovorans]TYO94427.1 DNA adenine methylase [Desulfallas thermosapovorans DSM 6562]
MKSADKSISAKPFVKWAGGKTQLLNAFKKYYPKALEEGKIDRYIEPFVGSGAVLFDVMQRFKIKEAYIFDINPELITTYRVIKKDVEALISYLKELESKYLGLEKEQRKKFYYSVREDYNRNKLDFTSADYSERAIEIAGSFLFLNKTCFNGLFRVNRRGLFNVPMGRYKKPTICNETNLRNVSKVLQNVLAFYGDFSACKKYINEKSFVYFDPPYKPLNVTSNFTSYSMDAFSDQEQIRLANFYSEVDKKSAYLMLSNSDPKNVNENDNFFDELYQDFNIFNVQAKRVINSKASQRGEISELIITNYNCFLEGREEYERCEIL